MPAISTYRIILRKEPEGHYIAIVPCLPGCITWGETAEHAVEMARDAIQGSIAVLQEEGEPVPDDNGTFEYSLQLSA
jgi:antitoxin HicB